MIKGIIVTIIVVLTSLPFFLLKNKHTIVYAQTVPFTVTYVWDAPADGSAVSYNCYLDNVVITNSTTTTCQVQIPTLGNHTAGVTSVNPAFIPTESAPVTLAFTLKQPTQPNQLKVK